MRCDRCGRDGERIRRTTRTFGKDADLLLIGNVPVVSCPHCGESYMTAETMLEIERLSRTVEAIVEEDGTVRLLEPVEGVGPRRALVTLLDEIPEEAAHTSALASEDALADWARPEEDEAWSHLQPVR